MRGNFNKVSVVWTPSVTIPCLDPIVPHQFLVNRHGIPVAHYKKKTPPLDLEKEIVQLLKQVRTVPNISSLSITHAVYNWCPKMVAAVNGFNSGMMERRWEKVSSRLVVNDTQFNTGNRLHWSSRQTPSLRYTFWLLIIFRAIFSHNPIACLLCSYTPRPYQIYIPQIRAKPLRSFRSHSMASPKAPKSKNPSQY